MSVRHLPALCLAFIAVSYSTGGGGGGGPREKRLYTGFLLSYAANEERELDHRAGIKCVLRLKSSQLFQSTSAPRGVGGLGLNKWNKCVTRG